MSCVSAPHRKENDGEESGAPALTCHFRWKTMREMASAAKEQVSRNVVERKTRGIGRWVRSRHAFLMRIGRHKPHVIVGTFGHRDAGAIDRSINQRMLDAYHATMFWPSVDLFGSY